MIWPFGSLWPFNWRGRGAGELSTHDLILVAKSGAADGVLGSVEACVSLWADAVASAVLASPYPVSGAERACLVREFLLGGESLRRLDIRNGRPVLVPARCANVVGASPDPATWRYQLDVRVPTGSMHASYPAEQVFHWRRAPRSLRRRRFAARNGSPAHDLSHVSGRLRRSAGRGGFSVVGEQMTKFGPRGPHGPPETAMRIDLSPL